METDQNAAGEVTVVRFQPVAPVEGYINSRDPSSGSIAKFVPYPLTKPETLLTFSGTVAIFQAVHSLRLPADSVVLCPSYNCGHELEPILRLGLKVECFRVATDLRPDMEDIERRLSSGRIGAVLITHYFGVGSSLGEIRRLCDRWGVHLVEDCAHALLSDNEDGNLGRVGDVATYSIRKFVPITNGGAMCINNPRLQNETELMSPPVLSTWLKQVELRKKSVLNAWEHGPAWEELVHIIATVPQLLASVVVKKVVSGSHCYDPDDDSYKFDSKILSWRISDDSFGIVRRLNWALVAEKRRKNYWYLENALRAINPSCLMLPGIKNLECPLFMPLRVENRMEVYRYLVRRGVHSGLWWPQLHPVVDWSNYPDAVLLKQQGLVLPIHQDLGRHHLDYMIDVLKQGNCLEFSA